MSSPAESEIPKRMLAQAFKFATEQEAAARKNMEKHGEQARSYHAGQASAFAMMAGILSLTQEG